MNSCPLNFTLIDMANISANNLHIKLNRAAKIHLFEVFKRNFHQIISQPAPFNAEEN